MQVTIILLMLAVIGLGVGIIVIHSQRIIAERKLYENRKQIKKEREATKAILELSSDAVTTDISDERFLTDFCKYAQRSIGGNGAAVLLVNGKEGQLKGVSVSGTFPPLKDVPQQIEAQLMAHASKHSEFLQDISIPFTLKELEGWLGEEGYAFFKSDLPAQFPKNFAKVAKRTAIAPIRVRGEISAVVLVVSGDDFDAHVLDENDCRYLLWINEIAALALNGIRVFREKREYEQNLQQAREEGMLQVSAGIIHNIGNAITVAKLNVVDLKERNRALTNDSPEMLINNELVPEMKRHIEAGDIGEFMLRDPGRQFPDIIYELVSHLAKRSEENAKIANALSNKLNHISEIIELQQRFIGELGTENLSSIAPVIESAVKIFEETFNKKSVRLLTEIEDNLPEILIDTSMMTQVYINLIKNAVEAMEAENALKERKIKITARVEKKEDKRFVVSEVSDNGPGIAPENMSKMFKFGFSTKEKSRHSRGYGLHSCMETVKKYGGTIEVQSKLGEGTTFKIILPA